MTFDDAKRDAAVRKAQARRTGRKARASGSRFEAVVEAAHARYAAENRALIYKRPTPVKPISGGSPFRAVWQEKAGADYGGALHGGRAVLVEVKSSSTAAIPLKRRGKPTVGPKQVRELATADALGAIAGVLVAVTPAAGERWFWLPWRRWLAALDDAEAQGRASLGCELLEAHGFEVPPGDWLAAVEVAP